MGTSKKPVNKELHFKAVLCVRDAVLPMAQVKNPPAMQVTWDSTPGLGEDPWRRALQYSFWEIPWTAEP